MSQEQFPGAQSPAGTKRSWRMGGHGHGHARRGPLVSVLAVVALIVTSVLVWPLATRHAGAASVPSTMQVNPTSGPAGTQVDLSGLNFPSGSERPDNVSTFIFDNAPITSPTIVSCGPNGLGFGVLCDPTSPYPFTIPASAQPGTYTFQLVIRTGNPAVVSTQLVNVTATFTVVAGDTATPTATETATATSTGTATVTDTATSTATASATGTVTSTPVPNAPTATITNTPLPTVPTVVTTSTPLPKAPTSTATATATPLKIKAPFVVIVRTEFGRDLVAVAVHTAPAAKIQLQFNITDKPSGGKTVFILKQAGVTDSLGVLSFRLKVPFHWLPADRGILAVSETSNGATQSVRRMYRFQAS
jgi:hypothetical protein